MNREYLIAHFDLISEAPNALPRLRRFIHDLAVRGRLAEQDPNDKQSPELLQLVGRPTAHVHTCGPKNWSEGKLGALFTLQYGKPLPGTRLESGLVPVYGSNGVVGYCEEPLCKQDAIIVGRKGSAGALNLCEGPSWTTDVAYFVVPPSFFDIRYLYIALQTLDLDKLGKGVKPGLSRNETYDLTIAVPPLAEQTRIVSVVKELMELCDQFEAAQVERENRRKSLLAATHHHLTHGADLPAFRGYAKFYLGHFSLMTVRRSDIEQLRQTILDLAIRGRLTHNSDGASRYDRSPDSQLSCGDIALPAHWKVHPLKEVAAAIVDCPHSTPKWTSVGRICVRTSQFRPGRLDLSDARFVSEDTYRERIVRLEPTEDDILYSREGGILGVACRIPPNTPLCLGQRMMLIRSGITVDPVFLEMVLNSPHITQIARSETTGAAAPRVNVATVKAYPVPVPPLEEQRLIVSKVKELMVLCDRLEATLSIAMIGSAKLLESILHEALGNNSRQATPMVLHG